MTEALSPRLPPAAVRSALGLALALALTAPAQAYGLLNEWPTKFKTKSGVEFGTRATLQYDTNHFSDDTLPNGTARFEDLSSGDRADLARVLRDVLARVERALDAPHYNLLVHSAPFGAAGDAPFHWHIEILPRLARLAGFEWGTGLHINALPPEAAAARLKEED